MTELGPDQRPLGWDTVSVGYERTFEPFARLFALEALRLTGVRPGARVLDVGAGTGALTLPAAQGGAEVLAVDFSPAMVGRLRRRLADEGLTGRACAEVMDGQALALPDGSFDAALSNFALIFFPDLIRGLGEMRRVLRPGGKAVVTAWSAPERMGVVRVLMRAVRTAAPDLPPPAKPPGWLRLSDPAWDLIYTPLGRAVERFSGLVNRLQFLTIRQYLSLMFGALVVLLIMVAVSQ